MPTYRLTVEYEGTRYHGWQEQKNARSVAGELRRAIGIAGAEIVELGGSGRTDAGVHALAQVAHLRARRDLDPRRFRPALNEALPPDIHVLGVEPAGERFHARHSAVARSYLYQVSRRRTAFGKRFVWWVRRPLDVSSMARACRLFEGRHDFSLFCERPDDQASTLVEVTSAEVVPAGSLVVVRLVASHFLWKMVRRIVGTLVRVGAGELDAGEAAQLLEGRALSPGRGFPAEWTAPPSGLFLERVLYPGDPPLVPPSPVVPVYEEKPGHSSFSSRPARSRLPSKAARVGPRRKR